jgi:hypothetical protein
MEVFVRFRTFKITLDKYIRQENYSYDNKTGILSSA